MKIARRIGPILLIVGMVSMIPGQSVLDDRYHTVEEIAAYLDSLDADPEFENYFRVDTIGYSHHEQIPILAGVISNNVRVMEDEPRVLFIGQVHAEEVLGVEAVLKMLSTLLDPPPAQFQHVQTLRQLLEIWIVPTANPEGLTVVHDGLDVTYRKNKHDFSPESMQPNDVFDYNPSIGNDVDGVDINRNFNFNWFLGDGFLEPDNSSYAAHYDYFRGPALFSETETQALRDLALSRPFVFSIVYHSSRSGNLSEQIFTSWKWTNDKKSPDYEVMKPIGDRMAELTIRQSGSGHYQSLSSVSRNGKAHDWFYKETGCFQYLVECGTSNLQPDSALVEDTADRLLPEMFFLMDRTIGYNESAAQITGIVYDGSTGQPLTGAEVEIAELEGSVLTPRTTDTFGRYRRIVNQGTYSLIISKHGYRSDQQAVTANNSAVTHHNVTLLPLPEYSVNLRVVMDSGFPLVEAPFAVLQNGTFSDTVSLTLGDNWVDLTQGTWTITVLDEGALPWQETVFVDQSMGMSIPITMPTLTEALAFDDSTDWYTWSGPWYLGEDSILHSQENLLYSSSEPDSVVLESHTVNVYGNNRVSLKINHRYETEWDQDSVKLSIGDPFQDTTLIEWYGTGNQWHDFQNQWFSVADTSGFYFIQVRVELIADNSIHYRGWDIGELQLFAGVDEYLGIMEGPPKRGHESAALVSLPYPNPSTGMLKIHMDYLRPPVRITLYNLLGQEVYRQTLTKMSTQRHLWTLNLNNLTRGQLGSGVYFLKIKNPRHEFVRKWIYLKN